MIAFPLAFKALTGNDPFPWQETLYDRFVAGDVPPACRVPTGLGKTLVLAAWLAALVNAPNKVARRLLYVVNRRTVVDQTGCEISEIRDRLENPEIGAPGAEVIAVRRQIAAALRELGGDLPGTDPRPIAISTLRGQMADNAEWSANPARPAVVVATVDMAGSRLLFSGYRIGFKSRPLHAGFLGQDTLLVHDESHLEPAFQRLLEGIVAEQTRCGDPKPLRVMALSATVRESSTLNTEERTLALTDADRAVPEVQKRINAKKTLHFHPCDDEKTTADHAIALALEYRNSGQAIVVYLRGVEDVEKVHGRLTKEGLQATILTGTMRGMERDQWVTQPVPARFLNGENPAAGTVYLVCTSAGEVGINASADHMVCDLTPFESMAQRLGRVNRFGNGNARVDVIHPTTFEDDALDLRRKRTLELLGLLPDGSARPAALDALPAEARLAAFSPPPVILDTTDILFDAWALTSVRDELPGRPPVADWLHGIPTLPSPPETQLAWREEVSALAPELYDRYPPKDLLDDYPLKPHELLRDYSYRVAKKLAAIAARLPNRMAWLVNPENNNVEPIPLSELTDKEAAERIANRILLLPPEAGGLRGGLFDPSSTEADDVADEWRSGSTQLRKRVWDDDEATGLRWIRTIDLRPEDDSDDVAGAQRYWHWFESSSANSVSRSRSASQAVLWHEHVAQVVVNARTIAGRLGLPALLAEAIYLSASFHDHGKRREVWQWSIGNFDPTSWLAKSSRKTGATSTCPDYRHEFGSLLDMLESSEFQAAPAEVQELALHLVATTHGRGRPHFPHEETMDMVAGRIEACAQLACEIPRRYARLQRRYGRWGLAYIESLVRAADWSASNVAPAAAPRKEAGQ